ncbi:YtxH domain-containing protein [Pedobacter sp. GR22-10]|uniref:YtxH domain-containing protein n=1 Tax=Pedobacter sp. GR22-10 TaxID=2994472 RepID=UPI0022467A7D|nr:YtxH domain-containing protein [Pedobacter sp. GR22-10]MCX2432737.1 YtxH domain-containing protein [Pedobacter sp. GR22-10]
MGLLKYAFVGAASVYALHYITKKRLSDGKSLLDDLIEKTPELIKEVNHLSQNIKQDYRQTTTLY